MLAVRCGLVWVSPAGPSGADRRHRLARRWQRRPQLIAPALSRRLSVLSRVACVSATEVYGDHVRVRSTIARSRGSLVVGFAVSPRVHEREWVAFSAIAAAYGHRVSPFYVCASRRRGGLQVYRWNVRYVCQHRLQITAGGLTFPALALSVSSAIRLARSLNSR